MLAMSICWRTDPSFLYSAKADTTICEYTPLDRVPAKNVGRTVELVEGRLQRRHRMLRDGLRRPAVAALHRPQRTVLAEQEDLVHAHAENLARDVLGGIAEQ